MCVCVGVYVLDEVSASLMNTIPADVRLCHVGEPKRDAVPLLRNAAVLSPFLSPSVSPTFSFQPPFSHFLKAFVSFLTINFVHSFTLSRPPLLPPSLTHLQPASALSFPFILCKRGVRLMSLFLGDYRVHRLCVFSISVAVNVQKC